MGQQWQCCVHCNDWGNWGALGFMSNWERPEPPLPHRLQLSVQPDSVMTAEYYRSTAAEYGTTVIHTATDLWPPAAESGGAAFSESVPVAVVSQLSIVAIQCHECHTTGYPAISAHTDHDLVVLPLQGRCNLVCNPHTNHIA